jgi:acylphosphatase
MDHCVHIVVKGMVQGVGFRYYVCHAARRLSLTGWVRNLPGGDVEIDAEGDHSSLEIFLHDVKVGPRSAHVNDLIIDWHPFENNYASFEIL